MKKEEEIKQIMDTYNKHKKQSRKRKLKLFGTVVAIGVLSSSSAYGIIRCSEAIDAKTPVTENNAIIQYDDENYALKELYVLTSTEENHICYLKRSSHMEYKVGLTPEGKVGYGYVPVSNPSEYIDIKTDEQIAIQGYENMFGYEVKALAEYVSFDDFDQASKTLTLSEEQYEIITETGKTKGKTLSKTI